jgi:hypothetical protein
MGLVQVWRNGQVLISRILLYFSAWAGVDGMLFPHLHQAPNRCAKPRKEAD